jgi:hypothetical protein
LLRASLAVAVLIPWAQPVLAQSQRPSISGGFALPMDVGNEKLSQWEATLAPF